MLTKKTITKAPVSPKVPTPQSVQVPVSVLETLQSAVEELKKDVATGRETNEMLLKIADKTQLSRYYARNQAKMPSIVKLRTIDDKVILGWRTVEDKGSYQDPVTRAWKERQMIEVVYEDGEKQKFDYFNYVQRYSSVKATVLSTTKNDDGIILKVKRDDNQKVYNIDITYVN